MFVIRPILCIFVNFVISLVKCIKWHIFKDMETNLKHGKFVINCLVLSNRLRFFCFFGCWFNWLLHWLCWLWFFFLWFLHFFGFFNGLWVSSRILFFFSWRWWLRWFTWLLTFWFNLTFHNTPWLFVLRFTRIFGFGSITLLVFLFKSMVSSFLDKIFDLSIILFLLSIWGWIGSLSFFCLFAARMSMVTFFLCVVCEWCSSSWCWSPIIFFATFYLRMMRFILGFRFFKVLWIFFSGIFLLCGGFFKS